jgi:hypothetical protein
MPENYGGKNDLPEWGHQVAWTEACKEGFGGVKHQKLTSSFDYAGPLTETVIMGNLAIRSFMLGEKSKDRRGNLSFPGRKKLFCNVEKMEITNFPEANQFVKRQYRAGWEMA